MPKTRENKKAARRCNCIETVCRRALRVPPSGCSCTASGPHEGVVNMIRSLAGRLETAHTKAQLEDIAIGLQVAVESVQRLANGAAAPILRSVLRSVTDPRIVEVMRVLDGALALGAEDFGAGWTGANRLVFETVCLDSTWSPDAVRAVMLAMVRHMPDADLAIVLEQAHDEAGYLAKYGPGGEWSQDLREHRGAPKHDEVRS